MFLFSVGFFLVWHKTYLKKHNRFWSGVDTFHFTVRNSLNTQYVAICGCHMMFFYRVAPVFDQLCLHK